jgi:hypothetical protein
MRDCMLCHRHLVYLAIDGKEMSVPAYYPCHSGISLFPVLALDGERRFIRFCPGHPGCSKMAGVHLIVHRLVECNLYQEDRMMSLGVLEISARKLRAVRTLSCLRQRTVFVNFVTIIGAKS